MARQTLLRASTLKSLAFAPNSLTPRYQPLSMRDAYRNAASNLPIISLRFDDDTPSSYTVAGLLYARQLVGTFAVIRSGIDGSGNLTLTQILQMQNEYGHEISCHSRDHASTHPADAATFIDQTVTAAQEMRALGMQIQLFTLPGTWGQGPYYLDDLSKLDAPEGVQFQGAFLASQGYGQDYFGPNASTPVRPRPALLHHTANHWTGDTVTALSDWQAAVNRAVAADGSLEILLHPFTLDTAGAPTTATFTSFLDWLRSQRDAGVLNVMTCTHALLAQRGARSTMIGDGSFEQLAAGSANTMWSTAGAASYQAGRTGGQAAVSTGGTVTYTQSLYLAAALRTIEVDMWATGLAGANGKVYVKFYCYDSSGAVVRTPTWQITVGSTWQHIHAYCGTDPKIVRVSVQLYAATANPAAFDDVAVYSS